MKCCDGSNGHANALHAHIRELEAREAVIRQLQARAEKAEARVAEQESKIIELAERLTKEQSRVAELKEARCGVLTTDHRNHGQRPCLLERHHEGDHWCGKCA